MAISLLWGDGGWVSTEVAAQVNTPVPAAEQNTVEAINESFIEQRIKEVEGSQELDDAAKKRITDLCKQALAQLQRSSELAKRATDHKAAAENIQQRVADAKRRLSEAKKAQPNVDSGGSLAELSAQLAAKELLLTELKGQLTKAESEPAARVNRRKEIRAALATVQSRMDEIKQQVDALPGDAGLLSTALRTELITRRQLVELEGPALQNELARFDAEDAVDLVRTERDVLNEQIRLVQEEAKLLGEQVAKLKEEAARQTRIAAQQDAIRAQPLLKPYADRNEELARTLEEAVKVSGQVEDQYKAAQSELEQLSAKYFQAKRKVESVGLTSAVGMMLRKQQATLPDVRQTRRDVHERQSEINNAQLAIFDYDDERSSSDLVDDVLTAFDAAGGGANRDELQRQAEQVQESKQEILQGLYRTYNAYFDSLIELDTTEQKLIKLTEEFNDYINERVLWTRSNEPIWTTFKLDASELAFLRPADWSRAGDALWIDARANPIIYLAALALFAALFHRQFHLRREISTIGKAACAATCCEFSPTLRAALFTATIAVIWPGVLLFLAWRLAVTSVDEFTLACATGLRTVALAWLPLELMRQVCRPHGLAAAHFEWPDFAVQTLRRDLRFLMLFGLPLVFLMTSMFAADELFGVDFLERLLFVAATLVLALFLRLVLSPSKGVLREYVAYHQGGWVDRLKHVWYWFGVLSPLLLGGLASFGFYYTARQLSWRLFITITVVAGLVVLRSALLRLVTVRRRRLRIEQARERRAAAAAGAAAQAAEGDAERLLIEVNTEESALDLTTQTQQTQRFLTSCVAVAAIVGMWMTWVDVFPAFRMFDRWPIWTTTVRVTEPVAGASPAATPTATGSPAMPGATPAAAAPAVSEMQPLTQTREVVKPVTVADLAVALLIAAITIVAFRNLPGLLEMSVLQRLPLESSVRYAINSLASYAIVLIGMVVAFKTIGVRWSQIQWLATALTFGLAFGLQEIFANFVAGLIILFERPIRVGDVVTVGDITGVVSRVRIRATTITNWDRKEFVVPNKEFITGRILNWTLSDKVNRIVINVGVAYGSDTKQVREVLLSVCRSHPLLLDNPEPLATFEGFGDNSLLFVVRCFLPSMENRLATIHELHMAIDEAFRAANIEIAFPQRDLHLRSVIPAWDNSSILAAASVETAPSEQKSNGNGSSGSPKRGETGISQETAEENG